MMKGRKPKPTAKKKLEGNPGKRKLNRREPKPRMSADITPAQLDAGMRSFADHYLPLLKEMAIFTDADLAAFELMSVHYATAWRAAEIVQTQGIIVKDKFNQMHKHPALQILRDNSALFKAYAAEFGLTPSARSRIQIPLPAEPDQLEMELFGPAAKVAANE
jgi:P27 family predicted phage terminase small subunit